VAKGTARKRVGQINRGWGMEVVKGRGRQKKGRVMMGDFEWFFREAKRGKSSKEVHKTRKT